MHIGVSESCWHQIEPALCTQVYKVTHRCNPSVESVSHDDVVTIAQPAGRSGDVEARTVRLHRQRGTSRFLFAISRVVKDTVQHDDDFLAEEIVAQSH